MNRLSIRHRLLINSLAVLGMLAGVFAFHYSAARMLSTTFEEVETHEVRPERELRDILDIADRIHTRMLRVLLKHSSAEAASYELEQHEKLLQQTWASFLETHQIMDGDPDESMLVSDVSTGLPQLLTTIDRMQEAYRTDDLQSLSRLAREDWFHLQASVLYALEELAVLQRTHAQRSYAELSARFERTAVAVAIAMIIGLVVIAVLSFILSRNINRRIRIVERGLQAVAAGNFDPIMPIETGTEIGRIAQAINATLSMLRADRSAIEDLIRRNEAILNSMADGMYGVDKEGLIIFVNPAACSMLGYQDIELIGQPSHAILHHHTANGQPLDSSACPILATLVSGNVMRGSDEMFFRKDGLGFPVEYTSSPVLNAGQVDAAIVVFRDITERIRQERLLSEATAELRRSHDELKATQSQLLQSEKMASVGQLAAGVAHEINNPIGFVSSNLGTLRTYVQRLQHVIETYEGYDAKLAEDPEIEQVITQAKTDAELDYLREDIADLLAESDEGLSRVRRIVADLKDFSHVDQCDWQVADINAGLESTLNVVRNELKYKAEVIREFGALPAVRCLAGQLNQVFMNLLVNAAHAIEQRGIITLRTRQENSEIVIEISDTGRGIPSDVLPHIFEPFFTTKPVGKGTGLGLSIAWDIVAKHRGTIRACSTPGQGTTFTIRIPVSQSEHLAQEATHG